MFLASSDCSDYSDESNHGSKHQWNDFYVQVDLGDPVCSCTGLLPLCLGSLQSPTCTALVYARWAEFQHHLYSAQKWHTPLALTYNACVTRKQSTTCARQ